MIWNYLQTHFWVLEISLIILISLALIFAVDIVAKRLQPRLAKTFLVWDEALLKAVRLPLKVALWLFMIVSTLEILSQEWKMQIIGPFFDRLKALAYLFITIWFAMRFIKYLEMDYIQIKAKKGAKYDRTSVRAVAQVLRIIAIVITLLAGLQSIGVSISAVLAFGGAGALAVALAAKDLLGNLFGGLMIFLDRPFSVGDWIRSPDREVEGTVENIGWRLTRIRTFDKRPLYIPNGTFSNISIENPSRMLNRRIRTHVGVRYQDATKMSVILEDVEKMLKQHPEIDTNQTLFVKMVEFGPSSLNFLVYTFTKTTDWVKFQAIQQDVFLKIIDIITSHGAECAFPTTTLHIPDGIETKPQTTT